MVKVAIISLYSSETPVLKTDFGFDTKLTFLICKLVFMRVASLMWQFPFKPFHANIPFLYLLKTTGVFLTFSASIEIKHWREMG